MLKTLTKSLSIFLSVTALTFAPVTTAASPAILYEEVKFAEWEPLHGDSFLVDTKNNIGYLIHTNGQFLRFPVVTGQRRFVSYIGRYYNATTPTWNWTAKTKEVKGDRITFGPTGRFIRLFKDGTERTAYGIHEYAYEDKMFDTEGRYGSMGCVIVKKFVMDLIEETFDINDSELIVSTEYGIDGAHFVL